MKRLAKSPTALFCKLPDAVRGILASIETPGYELNTDLFLLPTEHIPVLINELARIARERARSPLVRKDGRTFVNSSVSVLDERMRTGTDPPVRTNVGTHVQIPDMCSRRHS